MSSDKRPRPRNDDELFSDIVAREFDEQVNPTTPPPVAETERPPQPPTWQPKPFEFNLYDDDESYRRAPGLSVHHLSGWARAGLVLVAVAVVGGLLMMIGVGLPRWLGWIVVAAFATAVGIGIWQMVRRPDHDDDDTGTV
ncbi:MAG: hypothetical protein LBL92_06590 [Propionibacteriaceae bacterium]|nr:hypothetical protein [Propionibacteriaceae bacterium]